MTYKSYDELPLIIGVEDLAEVLNIGRNAAYSMVRRGDVHSLKIGKQIRISKVDLIAYLEGPKVSA